MQAGYRQCFDGVPNFQQYDAALGELLERHDFAVAARVAVRRLAVPFALSDGAKAEYLTVFARTRRVIWRSLRQGNETAVYGFPCCRSVCSLLPDVDAACTSAREAEQTAALSVLLSAAGKNRIKDGQKIV